MRAAHPYESRANKIATKSLLLSVYPKNVVNMALKIAKEGGNTFKVISITFFYYYFCNYVFLSGQEKSLNFSPVWRPQCFSMGLHKKPKGQENLR